MMDKDDLKEHGIKGCRLKLTMLLRTKPYDISMIFLIVLYTILVFITLAVTDSYLSND
jgi:hypothetical protein